MAPKLMFVDAPNAVGKDYFIENFSKRYKQIFPSNTLIHVTAKDFLPSYVKDTRYYRYAQLTQQQCKYLFLGHLKLLVHLKELLDTNKTDLIIVNRSFASFLIYNMKVTTTNTSMYPHEDIVSDTNEYISTYTDIFKSMFKQTETMFVNLYISTLENQSEVIIKRVIQRNPDAVIHENHIEYLVDSYNDIDIKLLSAFSYIENVDSGEHECILNKHFFKRYAGL